MNIIGFLIQQFDDIEAQKLASYWQVFAGFYSPKMACFQIGRVFFGLREI